MNMKPVVSPQARAQVLELRRSHSLSEVAARTGVALGTVKTICYRSGAFSDNPKLRTMFTLPEIRPSESTALAVPTLPN